MVLKGKGKFINRRTPGYGKIYDRFFIYVPTEVARDSAFPFKPGTVVDLEIRGDTLVVRKMKYRKANT
mgnify:CR=1 FL=1